MDESRQYGQQDFNLPHDMVILPSGGKFYKNNKKSIKVGYLTAQDENLLIAASNNDNIVNMLLKNKIYEPDLNVDNLLEGDVEAILIFLRNTAFGSEYTFRLKDPKTNNEFTETINLDELDIKRPEKEPNENGLFDLVLPKSNVNIQCRLLTMKDNEEINKLQNSYPKGMVPPVVTKRLEKYIVSIDGNTDKEYIAKFVSTLPIMDSKYIRNTMTNCEPRIDFGRVVTAPSGDKVNVRITFGAEFFRPFF